MIVVTVFLSILNTNGTPFGSENRMENCHHDHIPFNMKGNGNIVFSDWRVSRKSQKLLPCMFCDMFCRVLSRQHTFHVMNCATLFQLPNLFVDCKLGGCTHASSQKTFIRSFLKCTRNTNIYLYIPHMSEK